MEDHAVENETAQERHGPEDQAAGRPAKKRVYVETYGCQMNVNDSEVVARIMKDAGYDITETPENADAIFMNTCAIRENAEQRVWGQLGRFKKLKEKNPRLVIGVLGCMAKHLEEAIHKKRPYVSIVLGPDSYRQLPRLLSAAGGTPAIRIAEPFPESKFDLEEYRDFPVTGLRMDTRLSRTEVYEGVAPVRSGGVTAWISVMRGCDNFCTFCVVPYTRGRERSRSVDSVVAEAEAAVRSGYSEIGLLGQNVNSYRDGTQDFADVLARVSDVPGVRRIRFTSPHPKDFPETLLHLIAERPNICKQVHMPVQSGSNRILGLMNRTYTREEYLDLIDRTRAILPDVAITTDVIAGFPTETEADHRETLDLFERVAFDAAFMFKYSARPLTKAFAMADDVPDDVKRRRLQEIIALQKTAGYQRLLGEVGCIREVLIEEESRKSTAFYSARSDKGHIVIVPKSGHRIGEYVSVRITRAEGHSLFGDPA